MRRIRQTIEDFIAQKVQEENYSGALIGLSGGVDSATTAYLAVNALGRSNVRGLTLLFPWQRQEDVSDAVEIGKALGIEHTKLDISRIIETHVDNAPEASKLQCFSSNDSSLNLFERLNSAISLTWAEAFNYIIPSSSNKTEFLTSFYCVGGNIGHIYPLGDLYKTEVRELARTLCVPEKIIIKKSTDGFEKRKSDEEIIGASYEQLDRICYGLEAGEDPESIGKEANVDVKKVYEIQKRMRDSARKLSFPACAVYMPERKSMFERKTELEPLPRRLFAPFYGG